MPMTQCIPCAGRGEVYQAPSEYSLTDAQKVLIEAEVECMRDEGLFKNYWGSKSRIRRLAMRRMNL